tara:strand:- start:917 stop:1750 length:834 start_codon:yes stop_codon:yes gene_type:complete
MTYKLTPIPTATNHNFEPFANEGKKVQLATIDDNIYLQGEVVTSLAVTSTLFDMKSGDNINVGGNNFVLNADAAATATSLSVSSYEVIGANTYNIGFGAIVSINQSNLLVQYQRKTEGTIGGMTVSAKTFGPITYDSPSTGEYSIIGVDPNYVKILPRDFMINNDGAYEALAFKNATNSGLQVGDAAEMVATVNIPYGTTATEVAIWGSVTTKVVNVYECGIATNGIGSAIGTGTTNGAAISITSTAATSTNYLLIVVKVTATSQRIYGGQVTLTQN